MMRALVIGLTRSCGNLVLTERKVRKQRSQKNNRAQRQWFVQLRVSQTNSRLQRRKHLRRSRLLSWLTYWRNVCRHLRALLRSQLKHAGWGLPGLLLLMKKTLGQERLVQSQRELLQADPGEPSGPQGTRYHHHHHHHHSRALSGLNWRAWGEALLWRSAVDLLQSQLDPTRPPIWDPGSLVALSSPWRNGEHPWRKKTHRKTSPWKIK